MDGLRLRMRWKSDQDCWYLIGTEDSSAAQAEDAKFDSSQGVIIDIAVHAEAGATCGSKYGSAEEGSFGATRNGRNRRR
jgi:hypothetical protein